MPKKKVTATPETESKSTLKVTFVQIAMVNAPTGKTKALARVQLNDALQLTGLRVVEGCNGMFVAYPNDPGYKGDDYRSIFYPLTTDLREEIECAVLTKYQEETKM